MYQNRRQDGSGPQAGVRRPPTWGIPCPKPSTPPNPLVQATNAPQFTDDLIRTAAVCVSCPTEGHSRGPSASVPTQPAPPVPPESLAPPPTACPLLGGVGGVLVHLKSVEGRQVDFRESQRCRPRVWNPDPGSRENCQLAQGELAGQAGGLSKHTGFQDLQRSFHSRPRQSPLP